MKRLIRNSALIFVLSFVFAFPFVSFRFADYKKNDPQIVLSSKNEVLGASEEKSPFGVDVIDKVDLELNLGKNNVEKFYNVIPEEYLDEKYQVIVVVPGEYSKKGLAASLLKNELSADLKISFEDESFKYSQIVITLLVLN